MGKSAVSWSWFRGQAVRANAKLRGAFWWSFYEADAGFGRFVLAALLYTTSQPPSDFEKMPFSKQLELLRLVLDRESFLLVLDGFERELNAYARLDAARLDDDADDNI